MTRFTRVAPVAALMLMSGLAQGALAQPADNAERPALRGPRVADDDARGPRSFDEGERPERPGAAEHPGAAFFALRAELRRLGSRRAPEGLRLTEGQIDKIREIGEAFQTERRAYMDQHADEIEALRKDAGLPEMRERGERREPMTVGDRVRRGAADDADTPDDRPIRRRATQDRPDRRELGNRRGRDFDDEMAPELDERPGFGRGEPPTPEQLEAREKLRELMAAGPSPEKAAKQTLAVLTPEQREHVETKLRARREKAEQARRGERGQPPMDGRRSRRDPDEQGRRQPPRPPSMDELDLPDFDD